MKEDIMLQERVLALLLENEHNPVSGQAMSDALGVTRAAVWKAVESLRRDGCSISSAPSRGYCLDHAPDRIRPGKLMGSLTDCLVGSSLLCFDEVDSTNTECKRRALAGAKEGLVVTAECQTAGRGRLGRSFSSPQGKGLYLSTLLRPNLEPGDVVNFTAWVAVAVCDGIEATCGFRPGIKWTNDIVMNSRKLVGILTEMGLESETNSLQYLVTGIGINVCQNEEDFPPEIRNMAGSLQQITGRTVLRCELAVNIIRALDRMYADFPQEKQQYLDRYRKDCITPGNRVQLISPTSREEAYAESIDDDFCLVVRRADGTLKTVSTGEVSVRGMYGYV